METATVKAGSELIGTLGELGGVTAVIAGVLIIMLGYVVWYLLKQNKDIQLQMLERIEDNTKALGILATTLQHKPCVAHDSEMRKRVADSMR